MKYVSILGDSVSTYQNFNPDGYAVFYDYEKQVENEVYSVTDTWWAKVIQYLNARRNLGPVKLLVNNSYSGSKVSGAAFPSASCDRRIAELSSSNIKPDTILVYIGFNDFGYGVDILTFFEAYKRMIKKLRDAYPESQIYCGTLVKTCMKDNDAWIFPEELYGIRFNDYNDAIRQICNGFDEENNLMGGGVYLADLDAGECGVRIQTLDGSHPTYAGHQSLAEIWIQSIKDGLEEIIRI